MLSELCLPKTTSSILDASGGLKALVTTALKRKENRIEQQGSWKLWSPSLEFPYVKWKEINGFSYEGTRALVHVRTLVTACLIAVLCRC